MDDDKEFEYQLELLMNQNNDPLQNVISHIFESQSSNNNNLNVNNAPSLNNQSLESMKPINVPLNSTISNPPTLIPTPSLPSSHYASSNINPSMPLQDPRNYLNPSHVVNHLDPNYPSHVVNPLDPNWEAISAFLAGQVRTGGDVERVFKCGVCNVEFANAQALGGHMSSHTKNKKQKEVLGSTRTKHFKRAGRR